MLLYYQIEVAVHSSAFDTVYAYWHVFETYINIFVFCLKAFIANECLQKEKEDLENELQILEKKYHKVSSELLSAMQKLIKLETEKQACILHYICMVFRFKHWKIIQM